MGGEDKGLLALAGQSMIEHVLAALAPQVDTLLISANRNRERYEHFGYRVVPDVLGSYLGPLVGVASAMQAATTPYLLSAPCDSPLLPPDLAERLYWALTEAGAEISVAHDGERKQQAFALLSCALLPGLLAYLESGGRKVEAWHAQHRLALADFSAESECFLNVNTPAERAAMERRLGP